MTPPIIMFRLDRRIVARNVPQHSVEHPVRLLSLEPVTVPAEVCVWSAYRQFRCCFRVAICLCELEGYLEGYYDGPNSS